MSNTTVNKNKLKIFFIKNLILYTPSTYFRRPSPSPLPSWLRRKVELGGEENMRVGTLGGER